MKRLDLFENPILNFGSFSIFWIEVTSVQILQTLKNEFLLITEIFLFGEKLTTHLYGVFRFDAKTWVVRLYIKFDFLPYLISV